MALTCPNCGDDIPQGDFGVEQAVEDDMTDEIVAHMYDPDGIGVLETAYYCDPECFIEHND